MKPRSEEVFKTLNVNNILLPVVLGIGVALYLFVSDDNCSLATLSLIGQADWRYLFLVFLVAIVRDLGYMAPYRTWKVVQKHCEANTKAPGPLLGWIVAG